MNEKILGLKIKQLRSEHSLKVGKKFLQKDLANSLGISRGYISDIESGRTKPNNELLKKIAYVFNVPLSALDDNAPIGFYLNREKLKRLRELKGLTQKGLSQALGLNDFNSISKLENGDIGASPELTNKIALFFNVPSDFLYNEKEIAKCPICSLEYGPLELDDYEEHRIFHERYLKNNVRVMCKDDELLEKFYKLNDTGKKEAIKRVDELTEILKYTIDEDNSYLMPVAAHDRNGSFSDEDIQHDNDIMDDDSLWTK